MGIFETKVEDEIVVCMAGEGFEYEPLPIGPWRGWGEVVPSRPFHPLTVEGARDNGYLDPEYLVEAAPLDAFQGPEEQRDAFNTALMGENTVSVESGMTIGVDGCLGEARATIAGGVDEMVEWLGMSGTLQNLVGAAYNRAEASDDWSAVQEQWLRCIAESGYGVTSQEELQDIALEGAEDLTDRPIHEQDIEPEGDPRPTQREKDVALVDATCQEDVSLRAEWDRLVSESEQVLVAENPEVVIGWSEISAAIRATVSDVLDALPDAGTDPASEYTVPDP